ncbi:hypothetical protein [Levilactobacillus spicheri]|uniref:Uncharacterized protein n=1 Tax=Levilactobacillus spicheri TaxID=216463 RepID=A0A0F3RNL6_9LACO|nr:hypothetical protein [Levilactobacillus spicheri]KJW11593.1 hypothetical protein VC81_12330 [Levilactobacillus spicheri]
MNTLTAPLQVTQRTGWRLVSLFILCFGGCLLLQFTGVIHEPALVFGMPTGTTFRQSVLVNLTTVAVFLLLSFTSIKWLGKALLLFILLGASEGLVRFLVHVSVQPGAAIVLLISTVSDVISAYFLLVLLLDVIDRTRFQTHAHYWRNWWAALVSANRPAYGWAVSALLLNTVTSALLQK